MERAELLEQDLVGLGAGSQAAVLPGTSPPRARPAQHAAPPGDRMAWRCRSDQLGAAYRRSGCPGGKRRGRAQELALFLEDLAPAASFWCSASCWLVRSSSHRRRPGWPACSSRVGRVRLRHGRRRSRGSCGRLVRTSRPAPARNSAGGRGRGHVDSIPGSDDPSVQASTNPGQHQTTRWPPLGRDLSSPASFPEPLDPLLHQPQGP